MQDHTSHADFKQDTLRQVGVVARAGECGSHARNGKYIETGQGKAGQGRAGQGNNIRLDSMPKQSSWNPLERVGHPQNTNLPYQKLSTYIEFKRRNGRCRLLVAVC